MSVNQLAFLAFVFCAAVLYYCVPRKCQWMVLLGISLYFYYLLGVTNFLYVLITAVSVTIGTNKMYRIDTEMKAKMKECSAALTRQEKKELKARTKGRKKRWLLMIIFINLGILIVLKYGNFLIENINLVLKLFHIEGLNRLGLLAPLGISYYTLQVIGYALDVYKGKAVPEKNPLKVLLFVTYFPQITQGPINRYPELAPQLYEGCGFSFHNISYGCQRILWGLFKKAVIADQLQPLVKEIFAGYETVSGFTLLMGCVYMLFQLYADFSGYTDIVCGISEVFGIRLSENFRQPLFATSLGEYWRRWHMSLTSWFRDYVFYPVSISKASVKFGKLGQKFFSRRIKKIFPVLFAMSVVWFCTGIWHAASWRYILWGIANGVVLIGGMVLEPQFNWMKQKLHIRDDAWWWKGFGIFRTFLIVTILKIFPAATSTKQSLVIAKKIFFDFGSDFSYSSFFLETQPHVIIYAAIGLVIFLIVSLIREKRPVRDYLAEKPAVVRWCIYLLILAMFVCMGSFSVEMKGGFEYAQY